MSGDMLGSGGKLGENDAVGFYGNMLRENEVVGYSGERLSENGTVGYSGSCRGIGFVRADYLFLYRSCGWVRTF